MTHNEVMVTFVVPHNPNWKSAFADEAEKIKELFGNTLVHIHHIGSTAVPDILAKPIIDLLGIVPNLANADSKAEALESIGYEVMGAYGIEERR